MNSDAIPMFQIWGLNNSPEPALELPALVAKVKSGSLPAHSWIYSQAAQTWQRASQVPELKMFYTQPAAGATAAAPKPALGLKPGSLRRIKIFAEMEDGVLEVFLRYAELLDFRQFATVVKKGDHGDSMYLVMTGELRVRTLIDGRESILATLGPGEFFGEVALLDQGPRSADVLANKDSQVLRISADAIDRISREAPEAAAPFLRALSRSVVGRMRVLTKRYEDSIHFSRTAGMVSI